MKLQKRQRPEFLFVKVTTTFRLWALGYSTYQTKKGKDIIALAVGPFRFHLLKYDFA